MPDLELPGPANSVREYCETSFEETSRKFPSLRKYSAIICLLEAIVIALIVAYIFILQKDRPSTTSHFDGQFVNSPYRIYTNDYNHIKIKAGLVEGCNQRKHDLRLSVVIKSRFVNSSSPATDYQDLTNEVIKKITSSKSGKRFETEQVRAIPKIIDCSDSCQFKTRLVIDSDAELQEIIGWGGALTDSSINNILSLTTNGTKQLLDDYFGLNGLRFNMVRITIGGSDFSSRFYTNSDLKAKTSSNESEETLKDVMSKLVDNFSLREEDLLYKIPMIKYIQNNYRGLGASGDSELKLFASMWSPPNWMKTNNHFNKGYLKGSISKDVSELADYTLERYYHSLARFKQIFLRTYMNEGILFWGLTIMNEPFFAVQPFLDFNTMIFPPEDYGLYVSRYLGPMIRADGDLAKIKLIVHDDNRKFLRPYTEPVMDHVEVRQYVDGISTHGYTDMEYQQMSHMYEKYKESQSDFFILPTELCSGHLPFMEKALVGNWHRGVHYGIDIINSLQNYAAGWVDWNMALDTTGGPGWLGGRLDSPIIVDKTDDSYHKNPMYYVLGHFSRYIPPGSKRLNTRLYYADYDYQFLTVTFLLPNKKLATVVLNNNPYPIELIIEFGKISDSLEKKDFSNKGLDLQVLCDADSITTFIHPKKFSFSIQA